MAHPKIGNMAPAFSLHNQDGDKISLKDFKGSKNVVVYFYPKASTPGCTVQACGIRDSKRQLTKLGVMSWAPYYHPSGDYLIFTTNRHGFGNFELYMVDVEIVALIVEHIHSVLLLARQQLSLSLVHTTFQHISVVMELEPS